MNSTTEERWSYIDQYQEVYKELRGQEDTGIERLLKSLEKEYVEKEQKIRNQKRKEFDEYKNRYLQYYRDGEMSYEEAEKHIDQAAKERNIDSLMYN